MSESQMFNSEGTSVDEMGYWNSPEVGIDGLEIDMSEMSQDEAFFSVVSVKS